MDATILEALNERFTENAGGERLLLAVFRGSRHTKLVSLASPNGSDADVLAIVARPVAAYLHVEPRATSASVVSFVSDRVHPNLDVEVWDIQFAFRSAVKSASALVESLVHWAPDAPELDDRPIFCDNQARGHLVAALLKVFDPKALVGAYLSHARRHWKTYLDPKRKEPFKPTVRQKKYLYVVDSLLRALYVLRAMRSDQATDLRGSASNLSKPVPLELDSLDMLANHYVPPRSSRALLASLASALSARTHTAIRELFDAKQNDRLVESGARFPSLDEWCEATLALVLDSLKSQPTRRLDPHDSATTVDQAFAAVVQCDNDFSELCV